MKRVVFALFLAMSVIYGVGAVTYTCEEYYLDIIGDDSAYEKAIEKCGGGSCSIVNGTLTCGGGTTTCTCPSGYSGTCTGTNYSTCYKSCSVKCTANDLNSCPDSWDCTGQYDTNHYCTGTQYYGKSCNVGNCLCPFDALGCDKSCPSGYTAGGSTYNSCKVEASDSCYRSCTVNCSGNNTSACPANATCTYNTSYTYSGTQYYGGSCSVSSNTCPLSSFSCKANYYKSGSSCAACPTSYPYSAAGSTSINSCYTNVKRGCTQNNGSTPSGCASVTSWNACSCSGGTYKKYYNGTTSGTTTNETCTKTPAAVTASSNYYVSGTSCKTCSSYSSTYTKSDGGNISSSSCYTNITRGCTQNNGSTPSGCASVTAWNACSCSGGTYKKYASGSTSGTTSNETCTKTAKTVTASSNYYVSGATCPSCSSFSSTYTKSDGGNIGSGYCYRSLTNTGSQLNPSLPTGCAAQSTTACTPGTCSYKDYYSATDTTCTPSNCTKTHSACTSASANYYLASGVAKTCSSYSSSYPSSGGGNITYSSCYGSFSKSGSQNACSQPSNSASYTCNTCTPGTCSYTKYASGTIKTDCTPSNCTQTVKSATCKANYYGTTSCTACSSFNSSYPYSDQGTTSSNYCYASKTSTGTQNACGQPSNSVSYTCGTCSPGTCSYRDYYNATDTTCTPTNCTKPVASATCKANYYGTTSCTACPSGYPSSDQGTTSYSYCYVTRSKTGSQLDCSTPTNCYSATCGTCTPGTCNYRDYNGATDTTCTPSNCTKPVASVTAKSKYYDAGTTCSSCPSGYPNSVDGNEGGVTQCYSNSKSRSWTGNQTACSKPSNCASVTCNTCSGSACSYVAYANSAGTGDGTIKSGCSSNSAACQQTVKSVTANANYYVDGTTCPACGTSYPYSDGGNISGSYCYKNVTKYGSQTACSQPANSASYTCGTCTVGSCSYRDYNGATDGSCTPNNCTQPVASVSCKANYYASGVTCPACPTAYPYSDAGTTSDGSCYTTKTNTGSQIACSKPANSASYTCGTCTVGTCNWRDYKTATDTTCTPNNCTQPVSTVSCNTGYYKSGVTCPACTNKPANSSYTGTATSNSCPWTCNSGYNQTSDNQCGQFCGAGITHLNLGNGVSIPLYSSARTSPAINVKWNDTVCYGSLSSGKSTGLNVKVGTTTYHAVN